MISAYALQKEMFLLDLKTFRRVRDQVIMCMATMVTTSTLINSNPIWTKKSVKKGPNMTKNRVHGAHGQPVDYDMDDYVHNLYY